MSLTGLVIATKLGETMDMINDWILHAATAWWVLPVVFIMSVIDGFFPVVPSESLLVGLSSVWASQGFLPVMVLALVGATGAFIGDQIAYSLGRAVGRQGFKWMRRPAVAKMLVTAEKQLEKRGGVLIFTARYVPIGRVAVNFTAGATGYSRKTFMLFDAIGCLMWGAYSVLIGTVAGQWMESNRLLGIIISICIAMVLGWILDRIVHRVIWRVNPEWEETEPKPKIPRREVHMDPTQQQAEPCEQKQAESREQKQAERNPKDPDES